MVQHQTDNRKRVTQGRVVFYLTVAEVRQLRAYAKRRDRSTSYVVAEAMRALLAGQKEAGR